MSSLRSRYEDYVSNVSSRDQAISWELTEWLVWFLEEERPQRILDLGSGWSSYVLRLFDSEVWSIDTSAWWLERTREFLYENGSLNGETMLLSDFDWNGMYDLVFLDIAKTRNRHQLFPLIKEHTSSWLLLDDANNTGYMNRAIKEFSGWNVYDIKDETVDVYGRYALLLEKVEGVEYREQSLGPVSAIVSAHNEEEYIAGCLESILAQTAPLEEILVIDDRSTDRTADISSLYPVDIYEVQYGQTYMVKRAGICAARNDVVLVVDGDTELAPDFLMRGLRHLEEGYDVATGKVLSRERTPSGDLAAFVSNALPVYYSGPGYVLDRRSYMDVCKVTRENGYVDICVDEDEIPLGKLNLVKDPEMVMWTDLPSTGQKRMITGAKTVGGLLMSLRIIA